MLHQQISRNLFSFLLNKMRKKLSFASRVSFAQSFFISRLCHQVLFKHCFCFPWSWKNCVEISFGDPHQIPRWISWYKFCCAKEDGGLRFRNLKLLNKVQMMMLSCFMIIDSIKLRVRIMKVIMVVVCSTFLPLHISLACLIYVELL
jgi:hypothetical protein